MAHRCKKEEIPVKAQILVYPWIDGKMDNPSIDRNGEGYMLTKDALFWYQNLYTPNEEDRLKPEVSPCYEADFKYLAPAFVLTAEYDPLLDDGKNYYEQLKRAGNDGLYKEYPKMIHGFFNLPKISPIAMQAYKDIEIFLSLT
jgi:acetyl esterase